MQKRKTLMRAVARVRHAWHNHVKQITLSEGIPDSYRPVLLFLKRSPGASQRSIAEFAGVTTSAINQTVKSMLDDHYLRKEVDLSDKRNSKLYLTDQGLEIAEKLYHRMDASDDAITSLIGTEQEEELIAFLDKLADYIRKDLN